MPHTINEIEFTIFDTETTGLDPQAQDRIVEIAAVRFRGQERLARLHMLINPGRPISEAAFNINRITDKMLIDAPRADEVIPDFLRFIEGSCLCSYNAGFDIEFLNHELTIMGRGALSALNIVDILKMAKRLLPGLPSYALIRVAEAVGVKRQQRHRAMADVELTLEVFYRLKQMLLEKGVDDFNNFLSLFAIKSGLLETIVAQKLASIQEAIDLGAKLKIKYISGAGAQVSEREVLPQEIKEENNRSYLVGYCLLRNEKRTFRIDGILHLELV
ncbi:MAG: exonuclease domain-containing protein [Candidatus Omnitrophica bacterium]|nr:exonuclease domain-containing protein [Candidatus Omnitrophota bacterium]